MGLNLFLADYAMRRNVPWPHLLVTCGVVSVIAFGLSIAPARKTLIAAIPPQIFAAIKAGVGGLLVKVALDEVKRVGTTPIGLRVAIIAFLFGLVVILIIKSICAWHVDRRGKPLALLDSASLILSVGAMVALCRWLGLSQSMQPDPSLFWIWLGPDDPFSKLADGQYWIICVPFAFAVFFVLMMDIAGSPAEYVRPGNPGGEFDAKRKETIIERSLWLDSASNIVAPLAGVSPVVYYAENHVGWKAGGRSGWTAGVVALLFFVCAVIGAISIWANRPITEWIPKFAIMPALFFVGLMIVAESFALRFTRRPAEQSQDATGADQPLSEAPLGRVLFFFPAAITVVMVTNASFDYAIAAGILSYALISCLPESYVGKPESDLGTPEDGDPDKGRRTRDLSFIYAGALVVLILGLLP
jgi:AGZA family xanthine/uracil permease-like MFS transporter